MYILIWRKAKVTFLLSPMLHLSLQLLVLPKTVKPIFICINMYVLNKYSNKDKKLSRRYYIVLTKILVIISLKLTINTAWTIK